MEDEAEQNVVIIIVKSIFLCIFIVLAVIGNISVIHVIRQHAKLNTVPNMFVLNLAIADLLFALTGMPMILVTTVAKGWVLGPFLCNLGGFLNTFTCTTSIWTLVFISINRYVAVAKANDLKRIYTRKRSLVLIFSIWLFSATVSIPPVFGWSEFIAGSNFCTINGKKSMSYAVFVLSMDYFIPFFLMVGLYMTIFILLRRHEKTMQRSRSQIQKSTSSSIRETSSVTSDTESQCDFKDYAVTKDISSSDKRILALYVNTKLDDPSNDVSMNTQKNGMSPLKTDENPAEVFNPSDTPGKTNSTKSSKSIRIVLTHDLSENHSNENFTKKRRSKRLTSLRKFFKERRVTKMLLIVVLGFFFCWTPFVVASIVYAFDVAPDNFQLLTFGIMLACLNSVINPIIYALMNQNFRDAFHQLYLRVRMSPYRSK